jgi:hypothetical protein
MRKIFLRPKLSLRFLAKDMAMVTPIKEIDIVHAVETTIECIGRAKPTKLAWHGWITMRKR